jgi:glycosyltransferase involved in cell wall biosynthesis
LSSPPLPKVSALMGAYNYGRYIGEAIESAMAQEYPPELLELIIVDDGSTDDTASIVARYVARHPGRITFIQQANAGATAATNRARAEATGDLIALLDADDVWVPEKTRRQVELLQRDPQLGMVFSQMRVIDGAGKVLQRFYGHRQPGTTNDFARVLWENVAVQSSLLVQADLFDRIPDEIPYADWWVTLRAAQFKRIEYLREELVLYRWHGANITGGVGGTAALREAQKGLAFQRWVLRNFALEELTARLSPTEMVYVWEGLENQAHKGLLGLHSYFGTLVNVTTADREAAQAAAAQAQDRLAAGDLLAGCALLLRARAADPYDRDLQERFTEAVAAAERAAKLPDPLEGCGSFPVLTDAAFLLSDDGHLRSYAAAMRGIQAATLVIDASEMPPDDAASALQALVTGAGLADDPDVPMVAITGGLEPSQRFRLLAGARAVYAAEGTPSQGELPSFGPRSAGELAALARGGRREQN